MDVSFVRDTLPYPILFPLFISLFFVFFLSVFHFFALFCKFFQIVVSFVLKKCAKFKLDFFFMQGYRIESPFITIAEINGETGVKTQDKNIDNKRLYQTRLFLQFSFKAGKKAKINFFRSLV